MPRKAVYIVVAILAIAVILSIIIFKNSILPDDNTKAINLALTDDRVKSEISRSFMGEYQASAVPFDVRNSNYLNLKGNIFRVNIETGKLDWSWGYLANFALLVDIENNRVLQSKETFDVAYLPYHVLIPGNASWYIPLKNPTYVELNQEIDKSSIIPIVMDERNFSFYREGREYDSLLVFKTDGELNTSSPDRSNSTYPYNLAITPGMTAGIGPIPGGIYNAIQFTLTFDDNHPYYLVFRNPTSNDSSFLVNYHGNSITQGLP